MNEMFPLTRFSPMGGCGCKLAPDILDFILAGMRNSTSDPPGIGGNMFNEDCSFFPLEDSESILLSTVDFFSPIVDDAFTFGEIAAANALSDIYAKGGHPILALAILAWPMDHIPQQIAKDAIEGLRAKCLEAEVPVLGGHSILNASPILGLCVNGLVSRQNLRRNSTAKAGDRLFLTKPLGSGVYSTALKNGRLSKAAYEELVSLAAGLNSIGAVLGPDSGVTASTDVTGFGLAGHVLEMCKPQNLCATLEAKRIPILSELTELLHAGIETTGGRNNRRVFEQDVRCDSNLWRQIISDPQTNGGLLFAVSPIHAHRFLELASSLETAKFACEIGRLENADDSAFVRIV